MIAKALFGLLATSLAPGLAEEAACTGAACPDEVAADETPLLQVRQDQPRQPDKELVPAIARVHPRGDPTQSGRIFNSLTGTFLFSGSTSKQTFTLIEYQVCGLTPGLHGVHITERADFSDGCTSTGDNFNPYNNNHATYRSKFKQLGDLNNIKAGEDGCATGHNLQSDIPFGRGELNSVLGRAIVVMSLPDDLGRGGNDTSRGPRGGNDGERIACGPIETSGTIDSICPYDCHMVRCGPSTADSGKQLDDHNKCNYYCSQSQHGYRYCGVGAGFTGNNSIDCTACAVL